MCWTLGDRGAKKSALLRITADGTASSSDIIEGQSCYPSVYVRILINIRLGKQGMIHTEYTVLLRALALDVLLSVTP